MRTLRRASIGYLWRHPWQLALALLGIVIGVAVIVAVEIANSSARSAFKLSMASVTGTTTHQVVGGVAGVPEELYVELRVQHGFERIAPVVDGRVEIDGRSFRLLGIDPFSERGFRQFVATDSSMGSVQSLLTVDGAVLMTETAATLAGIAPGDRFTVLAGAARRSAVLLAALPSTATGSGSDALNDLLITDISTAQDWLGKAGFLSRIDVIATEAADIAAIRNALPPSAQLLAAAGRSQSVVALSDAFSVNLQAMSLLALLVGIFLIYNSVSFAVLQRRPLFATLRALGITRSQVVGLVVGESLALGLLGSVLGVALGIWLGSELLMLISRSINDLYFRLTVTAIELNVLSLAKGLAAGMIATAIAAFVPALEAASCPPALAQQRRNIELRTHHLLPRLFLTGVLLTGAGGVVLLASGNILAAGLLALFMLIIGIALCIPRLVYGISQVVSRRRIVAGDTLLRAAIAGIGASISRTGVAIVALAVAVSATVGVSIMVGSFRFAVIDWLENTLQADFYVAAEQGELLPGSRVKATTIDGVAAVSSSRRVWLEDSSGRTRLIALHMTAQSLRGTELLDAEPETVWPAFHDSGAVLVSEALAYQNELKAGDAITLPTKMGPRSFRIASRYRSYDANPTAVVIDRRIYDMFWDDDGIDALGIYLEPGSNTGQVQFSLQEVLAPQEIEVRSNRDLRNLSLEIFDRTFVITNVLYWLATAVAVVGILAAMLALQLERGRELATMRALGVTRWQLGVTVCLQSAVIGLWSGLAAVPLGLVMAWVLVDVINRRAFGWSMDISVDPAVLSSAVFLAVGVALLAGMLPAWRAARQLPALGMREE